MIKKSEPITSERLKNIKRMSTRNLCYLLNRTDREIAASYPNFEERLEVCYALIFDELYERDVMALGLYIDDPHCKNPWQYFNKEEKKDE